MKKGVLKKNTQEVQDTQEVPTEDLHPKSGSEGNNGRKNNKNKIKMNKSNKNRKFLINDFFPKNCRGTDKMLSMYWFVILVLVAGGVFAMVYTFYRTPYDVRGIESQLLTNKIADCISREGKIDSGFFSGENFNSEIKKIIMEKCRLNFNVENGYGENEIPQYFFEIEFYKINDLSNSVFNLSEGNINWKTDCFIKKKNDKEYEKLVKCTERRFYALDDSSNQYLIKILSGVGKSEKNVKL